MWGASTIDGRLVRTVEYDITDFRKSGSNLYADLIDLVVQGPSRLVKPVDLPTDFPGGGNALGTNTATDGSTSQTRKHGDVSMAARGRRCTPPGYEGWAQRRQHHAQSCYKTRFSPRGPIQ